MSLLGGVLGYAIACERIRNLTVDRNGRPYWLVAVDIDHPECPAGIKARAERFTRMIRLEERS
jgi:hypothetical protein